MLTIDIPGTSCLHLEHLLLDFNGTIAEDGIILPAVTARLELLHRSLAIHVVTADTYGNAARALAGLPVDLRQIPSDHQDIAKQRILAEYGCARSVAIGNGRNDTLMLSEAALGIGLVGSEGAAAAVLRYADLICLSIENALDVLIKPDRLRASLRN